MTAVSGKFNRPRSHSASSATGTNVRYNGIPMPSSPNNMLHPQSATPETLKGNSFVKKLYKMLENDTYNNYIYWNPTGTSFLVQNTTRFSQDILPKMFKHSNFSSFVRQLNMYGFHKVNKLTRKSQSSKSEQELWEFSHDKFLRDHPIYLDEIRRKVMDSNQPSQDSTSALEASSGLLLGDIMELKDFRSDVYQQMIQMQNNMNELLIQLEKTQQELRKQQQIIKILAWHIKKLNSESDQNTLAELNLDHYINPHKGVQLPIIITSTETIPPHSEAQDFMSLFAQTFSTPITYLSTSSTIAGSSVSTLPSHSPNPTCIEHSQPGYDMLTGMN
ncbi:uncharacterized protein VTP21DRAFT_9241 [Calcarisporiella thermophila]|uniref:uncharacterized protein n=1 Tax=Calcarisporiella thermophila TaxID=911321 RepID=UPI003742B4A9